jgi:hypothetical protein
VVLSRLTVKCIIASEVVLSTEVLSTLTAGTVAGGGVGLSPFLLHEREIKLNTTNKNKRKILCNIEFIFASQNLM